MPKICPRYAQVIPTIIGGTLLVFGGTLLTYGGILSVFGGILSVSGGMFLLGEHYHFYIDRVGARFYSAIHWLIDRNYIFVGNDLFVLAEGFGTKHAFYKYPMVNTEII